MPMVLRIALHPLLAAALFLGVWAAPSAAVALVPGDLVVVAMGPSGGFDVWRLDPVSFATSLISSAGLLKDPRRIAVGNDATIYVADRTSGVLAIDPRTGAQSVLVSPAGLGDRVPAGICRAADGGLYVTACCPGSGALLHVDPGSGTARVVASGDLLRNPTCITVASDGYLYLGESDNPGPTATYPYYRGSIVRIEPASGAQWLVAAEPNLFIAPIDIAVTADGYVWTAQYGNVSRRLGYFVRTRLADGYSEILGSFYQRSQGIAIGLDGALYMGDCRTIGPDCYDRFVFTYPDGEYHYGPAGGMAVVPAVATPVRRATWGSLKTIYR